MNKNKEIIGVIGAGTMGSGIAQVAASAGHQVFLFDVNAEVSRQAEGERALSLDKLVKKGKMTGDQAKQISEGISIAKSLNELSSCHLIIEAIVENVDVKKKIFSELESIVQANCLLASNTSSLSIASIAAACKNQERVLGLHFFNPATLMPLVEIVPGLATAKNSVDAVKKLVSDWGKIPVIVKDTPGFIVNRVARPFYGEAIKIFEEQWLGLPAGEAGLVTIDSAMKEIGGFRMGPFELMDLIGNDVNYVVTETVWTQFFYDPRYKPSLTQKRLFEAGRFGKKSGRGYYNYENGSAISSPEKNPERSQRIFLRILAMLINEAVDALYFNIASKEDIDLAMTKGVNYPKGLLKWCDDLGAEKILNELNELHSIYLDDRYRPSVLLRRMATLHGKFYN